MRILPFVIAALLAVTTPAGAQEPPPTPLARADIHAAVGWQNLFKEQPQGSYNEWLNGIFYAGGGAGWYWTDHLKTQIDFGAGTEGHQYRYETIFVNGQPTGVSSRIALSKQSVAVTQQYQFFRNRWFHPFVGLGVDFAREKTVEERAPVTIYDSLGRISRQVAAAQTLTSQRTLARPIVTTGFKAYMTRRAFFVADTRVMFRQDIDEVLFRFGFGVDF
jgi:hypothetical protein